MRHNVIAENAEYIEAPEVYDDSVDATLSQLVINQSSEYHMGDFIRDEKPKQFARLSAL